MKNTIIRVMHTAWQQGSTLILTKRLQSHIHTSSSSQSQKHSTVTRQTQINDIWSKNQQQPIVPIQQLFQHSSQLECTPADVGSNERRPNLWLCHQ